MATEVLTAKFIERLQSPPTGQIDVFDKTLPGFGIRVSKGGRKAWVLLYRVGGRKRRLTLGTYPALSLADARKVAGKAIQAVQLGDDPAAENIHKKQTQPATFGELAAEYLERYAKVRKRSWKNDELNLRLHILPEWGVRKVSSIKRADVITLLEKAETRNQPHLARQHLALIRKLFNWAVEKSLANDTPVHGVRIATKPRDRSRTLSENELSRLWAAWDRLDCYWSAYFKILLLTAQRRSEIAGLRWDQISDRVWTIPEDSNKAGRLHAVPLSTEVQEILDSLPRTTSPFVFPAKGRSNSPISGFSAATRKANALLDSPIEWRLHDLRRTATSGMARLGFPPHVLSAVLNHAPQSAMKGVLSVYNRYQYLEEKRAALTAWGDHITSHVMSRSESNWSRETSNGARAVTATLR